MHLNNEYLLLCVSNSTSIGCEFEKKIFSFNIGTSSSIVFSVIDNFIFYEDFFLCNYSLKIFF